MSTGEKPKAPAGATSPAAEKKPKIGNKKFNKFNNNKNKKNKKFGGGGKFKKFNKSSRGPNSDNKRFVKKEPSAAKDKVKPKKDFEKNPPLKKAKITPAYADAVYILRQMSNKRGSINGLISTLKDQKNIKQVYALAINVIKNQKVIKQIMEKFPLPEGSDFDPLFIEVLVADTIFGQKRYVKYRPSKETKFILELEDEIKAFHKKIKNEVKPDVVGPKVRYIRANLIKTTLEDLTEKMLTIGFSHKEYNEEETSFEEFKELALDMKPNEFMIDYHFGDMLVLNDSDIKKLADSDIYQEFIFSVQDKSSMLAIEAMGLQPGMKVLDACAAPGMKTVAIASRLQNKCKLYANDMDAKRYKQMRSLLHKYGANAEKITNTDFSQLDAEQYSNLDVILLDPSCSGSGMIRRLEYGGGREEDQQKTQQRVAKLAKFQLALLESALKFKPQKIVYCTCSNLEQENENVINRLLENHPKIAYEVIDPLPNWPARGIGEYEFSKKCLRADQDSTLTSGFFCCVLKRKEGALEEEDENEETTVKEEEIGEHEVTIKKEESELVEEKLEPQVDSNSAPSQKKANRRSNRGAKRAITAVIEQEENAESQQAEESQTPRKAKKLRK